MFEYELLLIYNKSLSKYMTWKTISVLQIYLNCPLIWTLKKVYTLTGHFIRYT